MMMMYVPAVLVRRLLVCRNLAECCLDHTFSVSFVHTCERLSVSMEQKLPHSVSQCYSLLGVHPECTEDEVRNAYLKKAKVYHPDGLASTNDTNKFVQVQEAYNTVLHHKRSQAVVEEVSAKKEDIHSIRHTVPQHRRYLTFDGIGFGSPSKREQQYKQFRVAQATESVYEHRLMKQGTSENALIVKDKAEARKIKISNMIDRVVDDLIRESMQRGDFDNLPGCGKPLNHSNHNPFIDLTTHNINKILVNNGFKPEWIMLSKEIRDGIAMARQKLALVREMLGPPPYSDQDSVSWTFHVGKFRDSIQELNKTINKFNFIVPFMEKQMAHFNVDTNIQKVLDNPKQYIPSGATGQSLYVESVSSMSAVRGSEDVRIHWKEVWSNIKQVFTVR